MRLSIAVEEAVTRFDVPLSSIIVPFDIPGNFTTALDENLVKASG
jgi:hypothetical protein